MDAAESLRLLNLDPSITSAWPIQLAEPHRHYHTGEHVGQMLLHLPSEAASREMIAAIWLHDIVYDPRAGDNEARSAAQAIRDLGGTGIDAPLVAELILGTKHHRDGTDMQNLLNDLDLGIFGASLDAYRRYSKQIRAEYVFVPPDAYAAGRIGILERYDAMRIFRTEPFADREGQAHANLRWEIDRLRASAGPPTDG